MADSIQISSAARSLTAIGPARRAQDVEKAVQARLLASVEQAGQSIRQGADRVQISPEAMRMLAAEQQGG